MVAPAAVGLGAALLLADGRGLALLWLLVALLVALLVWVRNVYGVVVLLVAGAGVVAVTWWAPPLAQSVLALLVAWLLLLAAPRPLLELWGRGARGGGAPTPTSWPA